jgi:hypothetical protein
MQGGDAVVGISLKGKSWAIPCARLMEPHVANLVLEGQPIVIAYCERCRSAIARDPVVNNQRLTFHLAGIYNGSILLADYETDSVWTPFTGEALDGRLKSAKLKQLPLIQCSWQQWLQLHPDTLVAEIDPMLSDRYQLAQRLGSMATARALARTVVRPLDERMGFADLVLGVAATNQARAYRLWTADDASDSPSNNIAINDTVGDTPVVVLHERGTALATAFDRRLKGKILRFATDNDGRFIDLTYRSHWDYEGKAIDGAMAGRKLAYVPSRVEDWYIWAAYNPSTSIYHGPTSQAKRRTPQPTQSPKRSS